MTFSKSLYGFIGGCQRERVGEMVNPSHFLGTCSPLPFYLFNITFYVVFCCWDPYASFVAIL